MKEITSIQEVRRNNLRQWIADFFKGSQAAFIEKTDINQGELSSLLKTKAFGERKARKLESQAGMPTGYLDKTLPIPNCTNEKRIGTYQTSQQKPNLAEEAEAIIPGEDYLPVRMASFRLQAGVTGYALDFFDEEKTPIFFRADWFKDNGYKPEKLVACQIKGDSMEPRLYAGDIVIVNMDDNTPTDGQVYAVNYEGELVIKRLMRDAGLWHLQSDNQDKTRHPNKLCSGDICLILGKVVYKQSTEI